MHLLIIKRLTLLASLLSAITLGFVQTDPNQLQIKLYYGEELNQQINSLSGWSCGTDTGTVNRNANLKSNLTKILASAHVKENDRFDIIVDDCQSAVIERSTQECKSHNVLGYKNARVALFGDIHLQKNQTRSDEYYIYDIYCLKNFTNSDMPENAQLGAGLIPDHNTLNTEHVWPQSRFTVNKASEDGRLTEMKKSDLHILYPSDNKVNNLRGNFEFADVSIVTKNAHCSTGKLGYISEDNKVKLYFEPPQESKGNIARSLFYFSTRYNMEIDETEEKFIRQWHTQDPVDAIEYLRNAKIYELQNVRNPFIDYPQLVDLIENF